MSLTASEITKDTLLKLKAGGARVHRSNNIPHNKRYKNHIEKGWPDLVGYSAAGLIILCEVKTKNDKLSIEQHERLLDCANCGGLAFIATEHLGTTVLNRVYKMNPKPDLMDQLRASEIF